MRAENCNQIPTIISEIVRVFGHVGRAVVCEDRFLDAAALVIVGKIEQQLRAERCGALARHVGQPVLGIPIVAPSPVVGQIAVGIISEGFGRLRQEHVAGVG